MWFRSHAQKLKLWWDNSVRMSMSMHMQCVFNQVSIYIFNVSIGSCITTAQQWRPFWIFHLNTNGFSDKNRPYNTPPWNWRSNCSVVSDKNNLKIFSDMSLFVLSLRWSFGFSQQFCEWGTIQWLIVNRLDSLKFLFHIKKNLFISQLGIMLECCPKVLDKHIFGS